MKLKYILIGLLLILSSNVVMGGNSTLSASDIIGNPLETLEPIKEPVKWLTGFALMLFVVASVIAVLSGGISAQAGAIAKNAALRQHGTSSVLGTVFVAIIVVVALMVFWFVVTKFLL